MSSVLEATPPRFSPDEVARIAAELFGIEGTAVDLGSERDQTFLVEGPERSGVLKISNLGEQLDTLELEAEAVAHVARVDPDLPVARQLELTTVDGPDGKHFVRLFERLQ